MYYNYISTHVCKGARGVIIRNVCVTLWLRKPTHEISFNNAHAYLLRKRNDTVLNADLCSGL